MTDKCKVVEIAAELAKQIKAEELPDDFDAGDLWYNEILANVRHQYTNYDQLLGELPLCVDRWEQGIKCGPDGEECPLMVKAHDILKGTATAAAAVIYERWRERSIRFGRPEKSP